jgi:hypothetical protein
MDFVVMVVRFQMVDDVLPVCSQDVARVSLKTLVDLFPSVGCSYTRFSSHGLTFDHAPVYNSATGAYPCAESYRCEYLVISNATPNFPPSLHLQLRWRLIHCQSVGRRDDANREFRHTYHNDRHFGYHKQPAGGSVVDRMTV